MTTESRPSLWRPNFECGPIWPPPCHGAVAVAEVDAQFGAGSVTFVDTPAVHDPHQAAAQMAAAACHWLDALSADQARAALYPAPTPNTAADSERTTWFYTPTDHGGLPLGRQRPGQQQCAMKLLATGLTLEGYVAAATIIGLENVLDRIEGFQVQWGRERGRDSGMYYVRLFGDPRETTSWAWRFGGHHLSVNYLIVDGEVASSTPFFLGADPASVPLPGGAHLSPLGGIEGLARRFAGTLTQPQRTQMQLLDRAVSDIVTGNRAVLADGDEMMHMQDLWRGRFTDVELARRLDDLDARAQETSAFTAADHRIMAYHSMPRGLAAGELTAGQRDVLRALARAAIAGPLITDPARTAWDDAALSGLHIAWGGPLTPDGPIYFRLQAPRLLYEYDNTQRDANHAHTVLRDPANDFGIDSLRSHYARYPH